MDGGADQHVALINVSGLSQQIDDDLRITFGGHGLRPEIIARGKPGPAERIDHRLVRFFGIALSPPVRKRLTGRLNDLRSGRRRRLAPRERGRANDQ